METIKIVINPKSLVPDSTWQEFRKVRAIIENENGEIALTSEAGKFIFPGGKCDEGEDNKSAIIRELKEETGMVFSPDDVHEVIIIESMYDDAVDYRTNTVRSRHTLTTYYFVKTKQRINEDNMSLTEGEIKENFKISFVSRDKLFEILREEHREAVNWHLFYDENQAVVKNVLR